MKNAIAILVVIILLFTAIWVTQASMYPRYGWIRAVEYDTDLVFVEDLCGLVWIWEGVEDLGCGDDVALLMFNSFTPNYIFDDVIIAMR